MLYTEVDLFCIQNAYTTSFTMHIACQSLVHLMENYMQE